MHVSDHRFLFKINFDRLSSLLSLLITNLYIHLYLHFEMIIITITHAVIPLKYMLLFAKAHSFNRLNGLVDDDVS